VRSDQQPWTRKRKSIAKESLLTVHNTERDSCTCRSEVENRAVSGNASENVTSRLVGEEYLKDIALPRTNGAS
jgi:hypothetical protein